MSVELKLELVVVPKLSNSEMLELLCDGAAARSVRLPVSFSSFAWNGFVLIHQNTNETPCILYCVAIHLPPLPLPLAAAATATAWLAKIQTIAHDADSGGSSGAGVRQENVKNTVLVS